jgi:hypothetical protein
MQFLSFTTFVSFEKMYIFKFQQLKKIISIKAGQGKNVYI